MTKLTITQKEFDEIVEIANIDDHSDERYDCEGEYKNKLAMIYYHGVNIDGGGTIEPHKGMAGGWIERSHAQDNSNAIHNLGCYNAVGSETSEVFNDLTTAISLGEGEELGEVAKANLKTFCGSIYTGKKLRIKEPVNLFEPLVLELVD